MKDFQLSILEQRKRHQPLFTATLLAHPLRPHKGRIQARLLRHRVRNLDYADQSAIIIRSPQIGLQYTNL